MAIPGRIVDLLARGLDVVWAGTFPTVVLQALWRHEHQSFVLDVRARLSEIERTARFGWIDHAPMVSGHELDVSNEEELAIAGYEAGWRGETPLAALVAAIDAVDPNYCDVALASAALAAPASAAAYRARLRAVDETPENLVEYSVSSGYGARHFAIDWARLIGATLCEEDAVPSLPRILDVMLELARSQALAYARDLVPHAPDDERRMRVREALRKFLAEAPPKAGPAALRRFSRVATRVAEVGDREQAVEAFATICKRWGPPRHWAKAAYDGAVAVLSACGATEEALAVVPELRLQDRVHLVAGFTREGHLPRAREQLETIARAEPLLLSTRAYNLPWTHVAKRFDLDAIDLTPQDLTRLIPVLHQLAPEKLEDVGATISARAVEMPQLS